MTHEDRTELFERVISMWPPEVDVSDKTLFKNGGAAILGLSDLHDQIESELIDRGANMDCLHMDWAIYTVLHQMARTSDVVRIADVSYKAVEAVYLENRE